MANKTSAAARAGNLGLLLGGVGAGAALMYLFDPERGRGRRARLSDQAAGRINRLGRAAGAKTRHLRNRAQGLVSQAGTLPGGLTGGGRSAQGDGQQDVSLNEELSGAAQASFAGREVGR